MFPIHLNLTVEEETRLKQAMIRKPTEEVKQCIFERNGFCRERDQCMFFHTEEICDVFLENA